MYDTIVIGAGGSGLAAAMYAGRLGMKTLVLGATSGTELAVGGVITTTHIVENYPGFLSLTGEELAGRLEQHARAYDTEIKEERVSEIHKKETGFSVVSEGGIYETKSIIYATGTAWKKLGVPGEEAYASRGVSYCALCDGPLFKEKTVAVIGGSDTAAKEALLLAEYADKVYLIARRDVLRAEPINIKRIQQNQKIEVILNTNVKEIRGSKFVTSLLLDRAFQGGLELPVRGIFIAIGHTALSDLAGKLGVNLNAKGEVIIDKEARTNVPGFFAAGDVTDSEFKQLIIGVAEGVKAAYQAYQLVSGSSVHTSSDLELKP
jgi:thioredoxin reductase (NADPH)